MPLRTRASYLRGRLCRLSFNSAWFTHLRLLAAMCPILPSLFGAEYRMSLFGDTRMCFSEGEVCEDVSVMRSIVQASGRIDLIPGPLYFERLRPDGITQASLANNLRDSERAHERLIQAVRDSYSDLGEEANRYAEKSRIAHWLS